MEKVLVFVRFYLILSESRYILEKWYAVLFFRVN